MVSCLTTVACRTPALWVRKTFSHLRYRMYLTPVSRYIDTTTEPHPIEAPHIVEELDQPCSACRASDQTVVQANGHQSGMPLIFWR